jgi:hypothetical protein
MPDEFFAFMLELQKEFLYWNKNRLKWKQNSRRSEQRDVVAGYEVYATSEVIDSSYREVFRNS